jgi:hypothetical protein
MDENQRSAGRGAGARHLLAERAHGGEQPVVREIVELLAVVLGPMRGNRATGTGAWPPALEPGWPLRSGRADQRHQRIEIEGLADHGIGAQRFRDRKNIKQPNPCSTRCCFCTARERANGREGAQRITALSS